MSSEISQDPLLGLVSRLPSAAPGRVASERIRGRAHALLAARRTPAQTRSVGAKLADIALAVAGIGYLLAAVSEAARLQAFFR